LELAQKNGYEKKEAATILDVCLGLT